MDNKKLLLTVTVLASMIVASLAVVTYRDDDLNEEWSAFKAKHNKTYIDKLLEDSPADQHESISPDTAIDDGDFTLGEHLGDLLADELLFKEHAGEATTSEAPTPVPVRHHFGKTCPFGYFACENGECLSPKWHCDGHYDCDDFSDETNCTMDKKIEPIEHDHLSLPDPTPKPSRSTTAAPPRNEKHQKPQQQHARSTTPPTPVVPGPKFNTSSEPLMLFSTGASIRGYWMSSRIYFDVFSTHSRLTAKQSTNQTQAGSSVAQAISVLFGLLSPDRASSDSSAASRISAISSKAAKESEEGLKEMAKSRSTIVGIDMDSETKEVYWVELGRDAGVFSTQIDQNQFDLRHKRQMHDHQTIVEHGLLSPEDVALDHVGKNLYITDAGLHAIIVCSIKYSDCKVLVNEDLHKPRAIIVDPLTGWLIFSDWGDHPGIFVVSMDGAERETLIDTDIAWPNGLAADYLTDHLYWADAKLGKIERIDLVTKKRRVIIRESVTNPFSLSVFENRLYWSDWSGNFIKSCDKVTGSPNSTSTIMRAENIYGIHIFHPSIYAKSQPSDQENPCWSRRCSHLCLLKPHEGTKFTDRNQSPSAICACPESMSLGMEKWSSTCYPSELEFVLISVKNYIAQMYPEHIGLDTIDRILYARNHMIHDVAPDWHDSRLFFFDAAKNYIYLLTLPDTDLERKAHTEKYLATGPSTRSMIYDPVGQNLYWLEPDNGTLLMCATKNKFRAIVKRHLDRPTSMVLDSTKRLFYIATTGNSPHILRTNIHGDDHQDLVITDDVGLPVSLHLDEQKQRLYWADARHETIESVDLDVQSTHGYKHASRLVHRHKVGTILAFTVYKNSLIWTIKNGDYLYKAPLGDGTSGAVRLFAKGDEPRPVAYKIPANPFATHEPSDNIRISFVDPYLPASGDACTRAACLYACTTDENNHAVCLCPELEHGGYTASNGTDHCPEPKLSKSPALIVEPKTNMPLHGRPSAGAHIPQHEHFEKSNHEALSGPFHDHEAVVSRLVEHHPDPSVIIHHSEEPSGLGGAHASGATSSSIKMDQQQGGTVWPLILLVLLSITALVMLVSLLILYRQGRLPRQVSHLSVSFRPASNEKDGAMLLLDSDDAA